MSASHDWLHVVICILVPIGMGVILYAAFGVWDQRSRRADSAPPPPIDYHI